MDKQINLYQIRSIIITTIIGVGIITLPRVLAEEASTTSWLVLSIGVGITLFTAYLILKLLNYFPGKDIFQISKIITGKLLAIIVSLIFVAYFIIVVSSTTRFTAGAVNIWMLPETPIRAIIITILIISSYVCYKDVETLSRFCTVFISFNVLSIIFALMFTIPNIKPYNLQPFFHIDFSHLISGAKGSLLSLLGVDVILIFHRFYKGQYKVNKTIYKSIIFIGVLYILLVESTIGYFGIDQLKVLVFPVISLFKTIEMKLFLFERVELFFLTLWLSAAFTTITVYYYCGYYLLKEIFSKSKLKHVVLPTYFAIAFYIAQLPKDIQKTFKILDIAGNTGIILITCIPVLLITIGRLRRIIK